jgi:hypothetical protein
MLVVVPDGGWGIKKVFTGVTVTVVNVGKRW